MRLRDQAQKVASLTKREEDWSTFKKIRNKVTQKLKNENLNGRRRSQITAVMIQESYGQISKVG